MFDKSLFEYCGDDVYVSENVVIKRPHLVSIGNHVAIDDYFYLTTALEIGSYIHIAPMCSVIGGADAKLWMGNFTTIAAGCRIICRGDAHMGHGLVGPVIPPKFRDEVVGQLVIMGDYSSLGTNVVIMPNVEITEGVVIGANSLVTKSILDPWTVWAGSPAKFIKKRPSENMLEYGRYLLGDENE